MLLTEDDAAAWTDDDDTARSGLWFHDGPDDDDGDGETDDCPTPIVVFVPWDPAGGDDDRR